MGNPRALHPLYEILQRVVLWCIQPTVQACDLINQLAKKLISSLEKLISLFKLTAFGSEYLSRHLSNGINKAKDIIYYLSDSSDNVLFEIKLFS